MFLLVWDLASEQFLLFPRGRGVMWGSRHWHFFFSHLLLPSCPRFGRFCFLKKINNTFSSEAGIKFIFSECLDGYHLTHTYCGLIRFHTEQKPLLMKKQSQAGWFAQRHSRQHTVSPDSRVFALTHCTGSPPPCMKDPGLLPLDPSDCARCTFTSMIAKLVSWYKSGFINSQEF